MGDRYFIAINCAWCKHLNNPDNSDMGQPEGVYFAPSAGKQTFKCEHCGKENVIIQKFKAIKLLGDIKI